MRGGWTRCAACKEGSREDARTRREPDATRRGHPSIHPIHRSTPTPNLSHHPLSASTSHRRLRRSFSRQGRVPPRHPAAQNGRLTSHLRDWIGLSEGVQAGQEGDPDAFCDFCPTLTPREVFGEERDDGRKGSGPDCALTRPIAPLWTARVSEHATGRAHCAPGQDRHMGHLPPHAAVTVAVQLWWCLQRSTRSLSN
jgi:hypothetical protein